MILVIADLLWQVVRVLIDERLAGDQPPIDALDDEELRRQARLRTLLPVLRNFAFFIVLVMASLSALAAMGLQIGPLLAGAGVVGIAVGFGAQTFVRDILSGVFFLLDDAFRGENRSRAANSRHGGELFAALGQAQAPIWPVAHCAVRRPEGDHQLFARLGGGVFLRRGDLRHRPRSAGERRRDCQRSTDGKSLGGNGAYRAATVTRCTGDGRHRHAVRDDVQDPAGSAVCRAARSVQSNQNGICGARHSLRNRRGTADGGRDGRLRVSSAPLQSRALCPAAPS